MLIVSDHRRKPAAGPSSEWLLPTFTGALTPYGPVLNVRAGSTWIQLSSRLAHATALRLPAFSPFPLLYYRCSSVFGFSSFLVVTRTRAPLRHAGCREAVRAHTVSPQALFLHFLRFRLQAIQIPVWIYSRLSSDILSRRPGASIFASIVDSFARRARF